MNRAAVLLHNLAGDAEAKPGALFTFFAACPIALVQRLERTGQLDFIHAFAFVLHDEIDAIIPEPLGLFRDEGKKALRQGLAGGDRRQQNVCCGLRMPDGCSSNCR